MKRPLLFGYQLLIGLSDGCTGALLLFAPAMTLRLMGVHAPADVLAFVSFIGAFVLSTGLACLYGARLARQSNVCAKLETVWLLTTFTRGLVAIFVSASIVSNAMEPAWATVAASDGVIALLQAIGLRRGWLRDAAS